MHDSTFKGWIRVRSEPFGYAVQFSKNSQTDAHDLGHALAAVITSYLEGMSKSYPGADLDDALAAVIDGIQCGLSNNSEPLKGH
jgi:hypothetical protein